MGVPEGLTIGGTLLSAFGKYQAGEEDNAVARYNAKLKEREAKAAEQKALIESRQQAEAAARKMSSLRAAISKSGAVSSTGTALAVLGKQAEESEKENLMIGYEGATESQRLRSEAEGLRYEGKVARRAGRIGAGATLLTGFGQSGVFK